MSIKAILTVFVTVAVVVAVIFRVPALKNIVMPAPSAA